MYGRAQPFGQPVMRTMTSSSPRFSSSRRLRMRPRNWGIARSASVWARPQSGSAGQAMAREVHWNKKIDIDIEIEMNR
eukprot:scaffold2188_cov253-Pinguiococcus_pyrenoidosus.AAC.3